MSKPTKLVIDCSTGIESIIELTDAEIAQQAADSAAAIAREEAETAAQAIKAALKASAKAKLVAGTPLTEEEAATIVL